MSMAAELAMVATVMAYLGVSPVNGPLDAEQVHCMARNLYHEAAQNEPRVGRIAIAQVVMNRVASPEFPDTPCDVIYQGVRAGGFPNVYGRCQFTWACDYWLDDVPMGDHSRAVFRESAAVAVRVMLGQIEDITAGATYYYNPAVVGGRPWFERNGVASPISTAAFPDGQIGNHRFLAATPEVAAAGATE